MKGSASTAWGQKCGATNRRGDPCKQHQLFANGRCRYHGGMSTGPVTAAGKAKALLNLKQFSHTSPERA